MTGLIRRALAKPVDVIAFRLWQFIVLAVLRRSGAWRRVAQSARRAVPASAAPVVLSGQKPDLGREQIEALRATSQSVLASDFTIFGHAVPDLETCNFSCDWRFEHCWQKGYFGGNHFYVTGKERPYDVKFPWELSRLHYLVPVLSVQVIDGVDSSALQWVTRLLCRWQDDNPLAYSVNWYPMEASMRLVNLVLLLDLVKTLQAQTLAETQAPDADDAVHLAGLSAQLCAMIHEHAVFVWYTLEFTDVRGNHYTANLAALLLGGGSLAHKTRAIRKGLAYAKAHLDSEISLQFLEDGVNSEKSCAYHKLVLELFLLTVIAREREGQPVSETARARLIRAAEFSDAMTGPDGLGANFGDTDDAIGLPFDLGPARSHGKAIALARAWSEEPIGHLPTGPQDDLAAAFIVGRYGCAAPLPGPIEMLHFASGGYVVIREQKAGFFFVIDIGEVGMQGRGGHGHNDLFSFELFIDGVPVVIDAGCPVYTGDLAKKAVYRSTASHAAVQLFDAEIARLSGHWATRNDAVPHAVSVTPTPTGADITAGHMGYARIKEGSEINRAVVVNAREQSVQITDTVAVPVQDVPAVWHFPVGGPHPEVAPDGGIVLGGGVALLRSDVTPEIVKSEYSIGYGVERPGWKLIGRRVLPRGRTMVETSIFRNSQVTGK